MLTWVIIFSLIAFRISELFVVDDGPFDIFYALRGWANKPPTDTHIRGAIAGILSCVHCSGLWISLVLGVFCFYFIYPNWIQAISIALASAGLQSIIANKFGRTS